MATSVIVDSYGRPYSTGRTLYPSPSSHPDDSRPRATPRKKIYEANTERERTEQVAYSRVIATKVTNIDAAIGMKSNFAVGDSWHTRYKGQNKRWGRQMQEHINGTYYRNCNILGPVHDFRTSLETMSHMLDKEADYAVVFDRETGLFQIIDYSRIGTGNGYHGAVAVGNGLDQCKTLGVTLGGSLQSGWGSYLAEFVINDPQSQFDGARIIDGCIVDANLKPLGYRILGFDDDGDPTYADIPVAQIHFNFEAGAWPNQLRGIPTLANLLDDSCLTDDARYYWGQAILTAGAMAVTRMSKDGRPANSGIEETEVDVTQADGSTRTVKVAVERRGAGLVELSRENGEEIKTLDFSRPSLNEREYIKDIETAYLHKHWPRALIYAEDLNRAGARGLTQQVRSTVWKRQRTLERSARWIIDRKIEHAMRTGEIPKNTALGDPYHTEFTLPGEFTIDEGNDGKLWLSFLGRGVISRGIICNKQGYELEEIMDANEADEDDVATRAERLHQKHNWLSPEEWLLRLNCPFTNPPQAKTDETEEESGRQETRDRRQEKTAE